MVRCRFRSPPNLRGAIDLARTCDRNERRRLAARKDDRQVTDRTTRTPPFAVALCPLQRRWRACYSAQRSEPRKRSGEGSGDQNRRSYLAAFVLLAPVVRGAPPAFIQQLTG